MREFFELFEITKLQIITNTEVGKYPTVKFCKLFNFENTNPTVYFGNYMQHTKSVILEHNFRCLTLFHSLKHTECSVNNCFMSELVALFM